MNIRLLPAAALSLLVLALGQPAQGQSLLPLPKKIDYQGKVLDASGNPLAPSGAANYTMIFRIYSAQTGGNPLWTEQQTVTVSGGLFSVQLGGGVAYSTEPNFDVSTVFSNTVVNGVTQTTTDRFIGVTVVIPPATAATAGEITPRLAFLTSPFSFASAHAQLADSVSGVVTATAGSSFSGSAITGTTITGTTITGASFSGSGASLTSLNASNVSSGTLSIANGGTGSTTKNFVDLTTAQTVAGIKNFTSNFGLGTGNPIGTLGYPGSWTGYHVYSSGSGIGVIEGGSDGRLHLRNDAGTTNSTQDFVIDNTSNAVNFMWLGPQLGNRVTAMAVDSGGNLSFPQNATVGGNCTVTGNYTLGGSATFNGTSAFNNTVTISRIQGNLNVNSSGNDGNLLLNSGGHLVFNNTAGVIDWNGDLYFRSDASPGNITSQYKDVMHITAGGYVGIGTVSPSCPLDVEAVNSTFPIGSYGYLSNGGAGTHGGGSFPVGIYCPNRIVGGEIDAVSDARIKVIKGRSNGVADLATLSRIEVTDYVHKDTLEYGDRPKKKLIAQQVEQVFPQAVSEKVGVVPDIFKKAAYQDGWVFLNTDLHQGDRVRLMGEKTQAVCEVLEVQPGKFRTDFNPEGKEIFVYGREVKDFRTIDYDAIAMLNVSATQEIKREKDAEIKALREENAALRQKVAVMETANADRDARMAKLEQAMAKATAARGPAANPAPATAEIVQAVLSAAH